MEQALWQTVLGEIELSISRAAYMTWFKNTKLIENTPAGDLTVAVPNIFAKQQFEVKFDKQIQSILKKNGVGVQSISYVINPTNKHKKEESKAVPKKKISATKKNSSSNNNLNPRYTLESFIVGSSNDLAYTAAQAVSKNPGNKYNPIFIYGGVGLGKTHLIQGIGNEIVRKKPELRVLYVSSEIFVKEFLDSIRLKKGGFSDKYRNIDVLIIDDIQFIAGKTATQEEFFHTFNALHQANKQIILTSDKPPRNIPTLTDRLRSRFEWGMSIDIQLPDFETRCAILETKANQSGMQLQKETTEYLANNIKTNVRELEGALNQLLAYCEMRNIDPDIQTAEGLLGSVRQSRPHHVTSKQIINKIAIHFQLNIDEILSPKRDKHIVVPRQIAMYLLRSELHLSFPKIAIELGRKDHTTAIHSVEKIEKAIKLDYAIREHVSTIREELYV